MKSLSAISTFLLMFAHSERAISFPRSGALPRTTNARPISLTFCLVVVMVFLIVLGTAGPIYWATFKAEDDLTRDCDVAFLTAGIAQAPNWAATVKWWHGSWIGTVTVPFWRPLTSYWFWLEDRHIGLVDNYQQCVWVSVALHLGFIGLFYLFAFRLTGSRWVAFGSVCWFAGYHGLVSLVDTQVLARTGAWVALDHWKNQPEQLTGICIIGACMLLMSRRWLLALLVSCLAVCFKEQGWLAFPMAAICLSVQERGLGWLRTVPKWFWVFFGLTVAVLVGLRWSAGPEVWRGYHIGSNSNWPTRFIGAFGSRFITYLTNPRDCFAAILAVFGIAALLWQSGNPWARIGLVLAGLIICAIGGGWAWAGYATVNGKIYVIGGYYDGGLPTLCNESYPTSSPYNSPGTHTTASTQIDGTANFYGWQTFTPTSSFSGTQANTSITYKFRTSKDGSAWTSWTADQSIANGVAADISSLVTSRDGPAQDPANRYRYLQVQATLTSTDGTSTPIISQYDIGYHTNQKPNTPTAASVTVAP